jgi:hypothetical protein
VKRLLMLGATLIALATAGPALADGGQSTNHSAVTVQVDSGNASPAVSANAPANVDAPVCVASSCSDQAGAQEGGGASAATSGGSGSGQSGDQSADESAGTVQVGSVTVDPAAAVSAPVNVNAPVCVASTCTTTSAGQRAGSSSATSTTAGPSQTGGETIGHSLGTVQVGSAALNPTVGTEAPANADAPGCVWGSCSSTGDGQTGGGSTGGSGIGGGGGTGGGGGSSEGGGTTGAEPGTQPIRPQTMPTGYSGSIGSSGNRTGAPGPSTSTRARTGQDVAGRAAPGPGAAASSTNGLGVSPARVAVAAGELPFAGLALSTVLVVGLALLLGGVTAWRASTIGKEGYLR